MTGRNRASGTPGAPRCSLLPFARGPGGSGISHGDVHGFRGHGMVGPKGQEWPTARWAAPGPAAVGSCSGGAGLRASRSERTQQDAPVRPCCLCSQTPGGCQASSWGAEGGRSRPRGCREMAHRGSGRAPAAGGGTHCCQHRGPRIRTGHQGDVTYAVQAWDAAGRKDVLNPNLPTGSERRDTHAHWNVCGPS